MGGLSDGLNRIPSSQSWILAYIAAENLTRSKIRTANEKLGHQGAFWALPRVSQAAETCGGAYLTYEAGLARYPHAYRRALVVQWGRPSADLWDGGTGLFVGWP